MGGDWFDHAADAEGAWLAIADAVGKATALSAVALGAAGDAPPGDDASVLVVAPSASRLPAGAQG